MFTVWGLRAVINRCVALFKPVSLSLQNFLGVVYFLVFHLRHGTSFLVLLIRKCRRKNDLEGLTN